MPNQNRFSTQLASAGAHVDYEIHESYTLVVQAADDGGACYTSSGAEITPCANTARIVIKVVPVNDSPTMISPQTYYIRENALVGFCSSSGTTCRSIADCSSAGETCDSINGIYVNRMSASGAACDNYDDGSRGYCGVTSTTLTRTMLNISSNPTAAFEIDRAGFLCHPCRNFKSPQKCHFRRPHVPLERG